MQDTNWKTWLLLFLFAIGVSFELMKRTDFGNNLKAVPLGQQAKPYSVKPVANPPLRQRLTQPAPAPVHVAAQVPPEMDEKFIAENKPATTTFAEGTAKEKGGEDAKKEEKCDDEKNPKIDPKTGKQIPCKKKKKEAKKKEEEKKEEVAEKPKEEPKEDDLDTIIGEAIVTGQLPQPIVNNGRGDDAFNTLEDWMKRLLNSPDPQATKRFIDHYQRNLITSEVYYKVTEAMLRDSRPQMKQLGVMCAGLTPSVISFQLLARLIKEERVGSAPRNDAEGFLNRYSDLRHLTVLERLMRTSSAPFTTMLATQKLESAAQRHLKAPSTTPAQTPSQQAVVKRNATYFQRFVAILNDLTRSPDSDVKDQAARTLASLQSLLNGSTATGEPPPGQGQQPGGVAGL